MSANLNVIFSERTNTYNPQRIQTQDFDLSVEDYSYHVLGGCDSATIKVTGSVLSVWTVANWLRFGVEIYTDKAQPVWWGYVHEVEIQQDTLQLAASLGSMTNRVAVAYSFVEPGSQTVGTRKTTAWADNLESQTEYGVKALLSSKGGMSDAAAVNLRSAILSVKSWPQGGISQTGSQNKRLTSQPGRAITATLHCRGWWETLKWQYYANSGTTSALISDQIAAMIASAGQLINGSYFETGAVSGVLSSEYRDGDTVAQQEILSLMSMGGDANRRLLCDVNQNRQVKFYQEPTVAIVNTDMLYMDNQSNLFGANGEIFDEVAPPYGAWCVLKDMFPGVVNLPILSDPTYQFIEASSWSATAGAQYRFRGQLDAASLLAIGG